MNNIVSVVMTVFNREKIVAYSIKSVLSQSEKNFELIIVENGSTDNSLEIVKEYEKIDNRIKVIELKNNVGPAEGRNIGVKNTKSNLIFMLDSDDLMLPDALYHQKKFINSNPEAAVIGCLAEYINTKGEVFGKSSSSFYTKSDLEILIKNNKNIGIIFSGVFFKKDIFNKMGGFDKKHPYAEDLNLWHKFVENNYTILVQKKILVQYRIHENSTINKEFVNTQHYADWLKKSRIIKQENCKEQTFDEYLNNFNNKNIFLKIYKLRDIHAKKNLRELLLNKFSRNYAGIFKNLIFLLLLSPNLAFKTFLRFTDYIRDKIQNR